jgi:regulator of protease activity HflC (stomatin/prohibitin superfamily)
MTARIRAIKVKGRHMVVLGWLVVFGLMCLIALAVGGLSGSKSTMRPWAFLVAGVAVVLVVVTLGFSAIYRQDVGTASVLRSPGGQVIGVNTSPGFSLKAPWNDYVRIDTRNQTLTMRGDGTGRGADGPAIVAQTSDNASATIELTVRYSIDPASVGEIYAAYRTQANLVERALKPAIMAVVRDVPPAYSAASLRQLRAKVTDDIVTHLQARWDSLGVRVESVDLQSIKYPDNVEESLSAIQTSAAKVAQAEQELQAARIEAEKVKTEAQAQSDADQIVRCGATSALIDTTDISGRKIQITQVTPIPIDQCQNRLNEQVLTSKYIDMLKLAASSGSSIYVVPPGATNLLNLPAPATK